MGVSWSEQVSTGLDLVGVVGYPYAITYLTGTVLLALVNQANDWSAREDELGFWVVRLGAVMVIAGLAQGDCGRPGGSCRAGPDSPGATVDDG